MTRVAIIGPGRVGTALALALPRAGHRVVAVAGRSEASLEAFGARVSGVRRSTDPAEAAAGVDLVCIATADGDVAGVVRHLLESGVVGEGQRVVHFAGSLGLEVLRPMGLAGAQVAAIHPAQTVPADAGPDVFVGAAFAVTTSPANRDWAHDLVADLGGDAHDLAEGDRVAYHAALSLGSNAVAAALSTARQILLSAGVKDPAAFLGPLAHRSLDNVLARGATAITGPVVRGDADTIGRHLATLDDDRPELAEAYRHLQRAVLSQVRLGLDPADREALAAALAQDDD